MGWSRIAGVVLLLSLSAGVTGCYSKITAYEGQFTVAYGAAVEIENFTKPIAPGAKLDVNVFANGTEDKLGIVRATSSRPDVLRVVTAKDETVTVEGVSSGVADLVITARAEGKDVVDRMFFHVAKPAVHRLQHACTDERDAVYVRGTAVDVLHGLATKDRRPVIGYGWVPVTVTPADALELAAQPQAGAFYRYRATQTGNVTMRSSVDGSELSLRVVDPKEITGARLDAGDRLLVGEMEYVMATVELGDTPVCSQNALTHARSLTPEVCKVSARLEDSLGDDNHEQLAAVEALKFGECELEMTLPELAGGNGIKLRHKLKVGRPEYPGDRSLSALLHEAATSRGLGFWFIASRLAGAAAILGWLILRARASKARRAERRK